MTKKETFQKEFEDHVKEGLTSHPKFLSSKYIYDEKGDKLFQQIMALPEYYLTDCEYNIIDTYKEDLRETFSNENDFDLIELGAGDGKKTKVLLKELVDNNVDFTYKPIDISQNSIDYLIKDLLDLFPNLDAQGEQGTYFKVLQELAQYDKRPKVILVLGSNIGNLNHPEAIDFLGKLKDIMSPRDLLFMGFDQKKDPLTIQTAYADPQGVTQEFNRNLLHRINKEMQADFPVEDFEHWEAYDPETGTAKSYLLATKDCTVQINALDLKVDFKKWETIHTEISQKYDDDIVEWLAQKAGLEIIKFYEDDREFYKDYLFKVK
ncbi:dimethylhistidine N-methyltransferase [Nonlabens sp. Hel1_33_55]|uniref:L-histidine N(alpha)-methyltransferase n=1 Tax=Nonlabens sp. Hel1_33_55 TaxID=1336802 RepID=UPI000875EFB1|nr:L-histidine N(alpha)-methyltransferase [Nonlabens sp. Hel1_33_55]SCY27277.1 dimethylhistidine N-methyltransferase [Nonlabens sp. Hel1_33_55]